MSHATPGGSAPVPWTRGSLRTRLVSWLRDSPLLEWEQAVEWCDITLKWGFRATRELATHLAFRTAPLAAALLLAGFWALQRIPGVNPLPWKLQLTSVLLFAGPWCIPYAAIRLGLLKPVPGRKERVRLRSRTLTVQREGQAPKSLPWSRFDAFDFGRHEGFDLVKLRIRERWLSPSVVLGLEIGHAVPEHAIREVLTGRGLREEPLGALLA